MNSKYHQVNLNTMGIATDNAFSLDILEGLSSHPKFIPAKYHYDERGSQLFQKITELGEYYPTLCELENLTQFKYELGNMVKDAPFRLIELGVGDGHKTKVLIEHFLDSGFDFEYVPIDCCQAVVNNLVKSLQNEFHNSNLKVLGITAEYLNGLNWITSDNTKKNMVLFLGSNIGNFTHMEANHFLFQVWNTLKANDYLLIGFDLKKDTQTLEKAYNDSQGITEEFNLNILERINRELGANFNRNTFKYHSFYNPEAGRVESWLMSQIEQNIKIPDLKKEFHFDCFEGVHIENSYKYNHQDIKNLAESTGFSIKKKFVDSKGYFADYVWKVQKMHSQDKETHEAIQRTIAGPLPQH